MWTDTNPSCAEAAAPAPKPDPGAPAKAGGAEAAAEVAADAAKSAFGAAVRTLSERRGLRVCLIGVALVLLSFWLGADSAAALPLLVIGLALVVIGAVGPRLQGRCSLEFGPDGSVFELRTHLAPPGRRAIAEGPVEETPRLIPVPATAPDLPDVDVVESHGETIELDVERLRRLLAAEDLKTSAL